MIKKIVVGSVVAVLTAVSLFCVDFKINRKRTKQLVSYTKKAVETVSKNNKYSKTTKADKLIKPAWATMLRVSDGGTVQVVINDKVFIKSTVSITTNEFTVQKKLTK